MNASGQPIVAASQSVYVPPYGTVEFKQFLSAGSRVIVGLSGDGDSDLDLYVYSPIGSFVGKDDDYTDDCVVSFTAYETGYYTIRVRNRGGRGNIFTIGLVGE